MRIGIWYNSATGEESTEHELSQLKEGIKMRTPHKWAKEIHAFADGFEIESASAGKYNWTVDTSPEWNSSGWKYRVKTRHQAVKDAFEAGAEVECTCSEMRRWVDDICPRWLDDFEYRVKERVFPVTSFTRKQLCDLWQLNCTHSEGLERVANAAIRQYILDQEKK
jgi:hypothetical protein